MSDATPAPDTTTVMEILRGAAGDSNDPDVNLAELLAGLAGLADADVEAALTELLRNAHRD
jgi:hypothetical protein